LVSPPGFFATDFAPRGFASWPMTVEWTVVETLPR
jgi:hypothetical protein